MKKKYYNIKSKKQTFIYVDDDTTIISTDNRVSCYWDILKEGEYIDESEVFPIKRKSNDTIADVLDDVSIKETRIKQEAQEFINETDWYVIRKFERDIAIPDEVTKKRLEAIEVLDS